MRAMVLTQPGRPLEPRELPDPAPTDGEVLLRVLACGVCRTDLHVLQGDLPPVRSPIVPGHEVVGVVDRRGEGAGRFALGDRIGIPWLRHTCGRCRFCLRGDENLCVAPRFTGYHEHGGYAEHATVDEAYAYPLPGGLDDEHAAPLLCAGIIGYRSLRRANPRPGGSLGLYGFGGSAHLAAQVAVAEGVRVHVITRSGRARELATKLGATSATDPSEGPPEPLEAAILFAPVGDLVPVALAALDRGGTLAIAGIHLSRIPALDYRSHLFEERRLTSVTANTRQDGHEFLALAERHAIDVATVAFPFAEADRALAALAHGEIAGAAVLRVADRQVTGYG
jgi:propanol-preferring alcohol dehydrogenase